MKLSKDLPEISQILGASPDLPGLVGSASTVQANVLLNKMDQLVELGMGIPQAHLIRGDGVYLKLFFSLVSLEANIFVPTNKPTEFLENLKVKIVATL